VDDAFTFGQIAAANALSDVYAMGGRPITALNIVGFPDKDVPAEVLHDILRGGAERVAKAGAVILGGHSLRDKEIKYGLAVTGLIHPDRIVRNGGAMTGDVLVLTKPLGSGILASAAKSGRLDAAGFAEALEVMIALNRDACEAMVAVGVNAATDITGFGLLGHAFEMAAASEKSLVIEASKVPLMGRVREFAEQGILTRAHTASKAYLANRLHVESADEVLVNILADAQTSGGLLISVAAARVDALIADLQSRRTSCASIIGRVENGPAEVVIV
jgi:selenide,water dikinase